MNAAIAEPLEEVGETAPKIVSFEIPMDKIGEVIGPKGKVINAIQQETGADISVDDDGSVVNITKFGAFINILPGRDGLLHISKMGGGKRIERVEDVLDLGDEVEVRVDDVDPNGKVSLSPVAPLGGGGGGARSDDHSSSSSGGNGGESSRGTSSGRDEVSFEDSF